MSDNNKTWKIATLNIQAGLSTHRYQDYITKSWHHLSPIQTQKNKNLSAIGKLASGLDVFGVQEVDPGSFRTSFKNQAEILAQHSNFKYWSYQANRNTGISVTANAIYSNHLLIDTETWTLPSRKSTKAPRGVLKTHIQDKNTKETWCCAVAHFSLNARDRLAQAAFLAERLQDEKNIILMGDFNDTPDSKSLSPLARIMGGHTNEPTYPRWSPKKNIDIIWWKDLDVINSKAHQWCETDHCAVELSFNIKDK